MGPSGTVNTQQATLHPSIVEQIHAKEADVQALSELTRVLDKKVLHLVSQSYINCRCFLRIDLFSLLVFMKVVYWNVSLLLCACMLVL